MDTYSPNHIDFYDGSVNLRINLNPYLTVKQQYLHARERLVCNNTVREHTAAKTIRKMANARYRVDYGCMDELILELINPGPK
jgi:hypothetical protein